VCASNGPKSFKKRWEILFAVVRYHSFHKVSTYGVKIISSFNNVGSPDVSPLFRVRGAAFPRRRQRPWTANFAYYGVSIGSMTIRHSRIFIILCRTYSPSRVADCDFRNSPLFGVCDTPRQFGPLYGVVLVSVSYRGLWERLFRQSVVATKENLVFGVCACVKI
jgi:hypothetical protein